MKLRKTMALECFEAGIRFIVLKNSVVVDFTYSKGMTF